MLMQAGLSVLLLMMTNWPIRLTTLLPIVVNVYELNRAGSVRGLGECYPTKN